MFLHTNAKKVNKRCTQIVLILERFLTYFMIILERFLMYFMIILNRILTYFMTDILGFALMITNPRLLSPPQTVTKKSKKKDRTKMLSKYLDDENIVVSDDMHSQCYFHSISMSFKLLTKISGMYFSLHWLFLKHHYFRIYMILFDNF